MGEWTDVSLGTLAAPNNGAIAIGPFGSAMKADTYVPSGVPVIRGTNISNTRAWKGDWVYISDDFADSMPRCVVKPNTLVFPHRGSVGEVALVPPRAYSRYFLSTSLMKIELDEKKASPLFVYYFFKSSAGREEILKYASQVGTPGIGQPLASLRSFKLPHPPLPIQRAIASVLGALDDKIDLNCQMNETLVAMARVIFKDWFVDFGPTRAKMEGRAPYLAPEIWSLFPDRLDDEGKPAGWSIASIYEAASVIYGAPFASSQFNSTKNGIPLVRIRDLPSEKPGVWTEEVHPKGYKIQPGDILVGMDGEFRAYLWGGDEAWLNQRVCCFVPKPGYSAAFLHNSIIAPLAFVEATENATTVIHLGKGDIDKFEVMLATPAIHKVFNNLVQPFYDKIVAQ
ncbi:restriction endonuclease subunit S [Acidocella aromatica]|uniref:Type I restriction enzyme S subunit n=1 Tax=Acidocella aromatica TaxID=1303579 RepID=A0A840VQV3_9PROT|nr:restriction endonuclease subunit S [Acidocella aromatica]MBB5374489.1 type I restriction enzyme S subunit [Acidocella aromatica]